jgi:hypothetical protein
VTKQVFSDKEQYPSADQQNIAKCFSLLWDKPISQHCVGDILVSGRE